jgi:peptide subunit release factor 1 (eRF1)
LLRHDYRIALVLVRLGAYAIGICHGERLVTSKVGTGLVHGRHKKGGSSAHRFERHRDKQIEYFLTRVCGRLREQLEPHIQALDFVVYGGARTTIQLLKKQCQFVEKLGKPTLPPLFDIPAPRQSVLETAVSRVWSSTVMEWREA